MANNELAIRFTEEKYATKAEVARELRISSVDTFWNNILAYRSNFSQYLTIKTIDKNMLVFCSCPSVNSLINNFENKLIRINREFSSMSTNSKEGKYVDVQSRLLALKTLSRAHDLQVDDSYLKTIINENPLDILPSNKILKGYNEALNYIYKSHYDPIDEDYLAELYSRILLTNELTSFYRNVEDNNRENRVLIDRIYTCAPTNLIENMMGNLFSFISSSSLSPTIKAIVTYFYINYIRPFPMYSDEIAILMAKAILAHESFGELAAVLPFEYLIYEKQDEIAKLYIEVQKTGDITYFINFAIRFLNMKCDELLDTIVNANKLALADDYYQEEKPVTEEEQLSLLDDESIQFEEPQINEVSEEDTKPKEEENDSEINQQEQVSSKEEVKKKTIKVTYVQEELAVSYIPVALDEKQANLLEQDLLERDTALKKGEAHFYARHCSKGKSYTIAQYKKSMRCAYETARTSMDHLAELGYYRKEQYKNKYVYTPIPR